MTLLLNCSENSFQEMVAPRLNMADRREQKVIKKKINFLSRAQKKNTKRGTPGPEDPGDIHSGIGSI